MFIASMNLLIWFLGNISSLGSNLGKSFFRCLDRGFWGPGMARELIVRHRWLDAMLPPKVKFNWGDGIEAKGGLVSGGSWGPKPPAWVSGKSKNVGSSPWKPARFRNWGSLEVLEWDIYVLGWWISKIEIQLRRWVRI